MQIRSLLHSGILHRSAEVAFATALKSFVEDLLRKCCANKHRTTTSQRYQLISIHHFFSQIEKWKLNL